MMGEKKTIARDPWKGVGCCDVGLCCTSALISKRCFEDMQMCKHSIQLQHYKPSLSFCGIWEGHSSFKVLL